MSSIGIICRADRTLEALPVDWVPTVLGLRCGVEEAVARFMPENGTLFLTMRIEDESESADPRTISVAGVWGTRELGIVKQICDELSARFYDAESGEFIDL